MMPLSHEHHLWRRRIFVSTWLSYVAFYFCRKPFSAAKSAIGSEAHWTATTLGNIWACFLVAYALGQFCAAALSSKYGPRRTVLFGMTVSIGATLAMGATLSAPSMMALAALNGFAQATGWSGTVGTMAGWFHARERGKVMGAWSNCFTVGSLSSAWVMAWVLTRESHWRHCFVTGAIALALASVVFFVFQRNTPADVGLSPITTDENMSPGQVSEPVSTPLSRDRWTNLVLVGVFYFFAKFIRYAIWSWAAYVLQSHFHLSSARANSYATVFDLMGICGIFVTGWLSDRVFRSRRSGVALLMMLTMTAITGLLVISTSADMNVILFAALLGAVGFTLYGPDAILSSTAAIDIGKQDRAAFATAIISGFGSFGAVVQEVVISRVYDAKHGTIGPMVTMLFASAACASVVCAVLLARDRTGRGV